VRGGGKLRPVRRAFAEDDAYAADDAGAVGDDPDDFDAPRDLGVQAFV
jgi:hypothetical protein